VGLRQKASNHLVQKSSLLLGTVSLAHGVAHVLVVSAGVYDKTGSHSLLSVYDLLPQL